MSRTATGQWSFSVQTCFFSIPPSYIPLVFVVVAVVVVVVAVVFVVVVLLLLRPGITVMVDWA